MSVESADEQASTDSSGAVEKNVAALETTEEREVVDVDHASPRIAQGLSFVMALFGALLTVPFAVLAIPFGVSGLVLVTGGLVRDSKGWLTTGVGLILTGSIITGAYGAVSPELMLVSLAATLVAWDSGQHGMVIGRQLGRQARSVRSYLTHTAINALVVGVISATTYLAYVLASGGRHATAVTLALLGVIIVGWLYRA